MAKKSIWLSEQQICDILERDQYEHFNLECFGQDFSTRIHREFPIGRGRIDFVHFIKGKMAAPVVDLFEVKITASLDSIHQVLKYKRDLEEYLRRFYYTGTIDHTKCPKLSMNLVARYFDVEILELCSELQISLWRVHVLTNDKIELDLLNGCPDFPEVPESPDLERTLFDFFGGQNG